MTRLHCSFWWMTVAMSACVARGQVTVTYAPTTLEPSVATPITIDVTDNSGSGVEINVVALQFEQTGGLVLDGFSWLVPDFDDTVRWFSSDMLPAPQAVAFGQDTVSIAPDATLSLATVTVTATAAAAGTTQTLTVFPDDPQSEATISDATGTPVEILAGGSVELNVSGGVNGGGTDGTGGGGGNAGGGGGGDGGNAPPDGGSTPPDAGGQDAGGGGDTGGGSGADAGAGVGDPTDGMIDGGQDVGADQGADAGAGGGMGSDGGGGVDGNGGADGGAGAGDGVANTPSDTSGGDGQPGSESSGSAAGGATPVCGIGMVGPGLFTLCCLSVIKLHKRRGW